MTRSKPIAFLATAALIPLTALAVTGCGGGGNNNATGASPAPKAAHTRPAMVKVANSRLGKILVDSRGRTLYLFTKDSGSRSTCTGACATPWPPLLADGTTTVSGGALASMVGTTRRSDTTPQVTYNGHPLYLFAKDKSPGDTNGEGVSAFGGSWFAVSPAGNRVLKRSAKSGSGSSSRQPAAPAATPTKKPAPRAAAPAAPPAAPAAPKPAPKPQSKPKSNPIPQGGGGDGDADNNGGPSDGDGGI
jgi:predicted lipoprotein with Yx(FWY)xxD motif